MNLFADQVYVEPKEDDYPFAVGFRDSGAHYCVVLTRFSDMTPDNGTINVMVRDQIHARTANLTVELSRTQCRVFLDEKTATTLLDIREYVIEFHVNDATFDLMTQFLQTIFHGLPGLTSAACHTRETESGGGGKAGEGETGSE